MGNRGHTFAKQFFFQAVEAGRLQGRNLSQSIFVRCDFIQRGQTSGKVVQACVAAVSDACHNVFV